MARAKIVVEAERKGLFLKRGLWLTGGGRVVKPGWGEYAAEPDDIELIDKADIENGVSMEAFNRRWKRAMRTWKRR